MPRMVVVAAFAGSVILTGFVGRNALAQTGPPGYAGAVHSPGPRFAAVRGRPPRMRPVRRAPQQFRMAAPSRWSSLQRRQDGERPERASEYPKLNAPLYPVPRPDVPYQVGGTMVTNQAFFPEEMLYPHTNRSLYPPYHYRVSGVWKLTPWGVRSFEKWELQGTEVKVKYHPRISVFSGFVPPWTP